MDNVGNALRRRWCLPTLRIVERRFGNYPDAVSNCQQTGCHGPIFTDIAWTLIRALHSMEALQRPLKVAARVRIPLGLLEYVLV